MNNESKNSTLRSDEVSYRLVFATRCDAAGIVDATLTSSLLDPTIHERESLQVAFADGSDASRIGNISLNSFQMDSLAEYLRIQDSVRQLLQAAIQVHLSVWDPRGKLGRGNDVWKNIKVSSVHFMVPKSTIPQELDAHIAAAKKAAPNLPQAILDQMATRAAQQPARTAFTILLRANWVDDHQRLAIFRDGKLLELRVEG